MTAKRASKRDVQTEAAHVVSWLRETYEIQPGGEARIEIRPAEEIQAYIDRHPSAKAMAPLTLLRAVQKHPAIEQEESARGRRPARWKITGKHVARTVEPVAPAPPAAPAPSAPALNGLAQLLQGTVVQDNLRLHETLDLVIAQLEDALIVAREARNVGTVDTAQSVL